MCVVCVCVVLPFILDVRLVGECFWLRDRIDIARANQKPLLHIARTNHLAVFDIATNLRRLNIGNIGA